MKRKVLLSSLGAGALLIGGPTLYYAPGLVPSASYQPGDRARDPGQNADRGGRDKPSEGGGGGRQREGGDRKPDSDDGKTTVNPDHIKTIPEIRKEVSQRDKDFNAVAEAGNVNEGKPSPPPPKPKPVETPKPSKEKTSDRSGHHD